MSRSPYFIGNIGETVSPSVFPPSNYLIDDSRYSYEGNWAFCRFDSDEVSGARFGFGRGVFDWRDYGSTEALDPSNLWLHLELMTRDGAVLWIGTGKFKAKEVRLNAGKMDACLRGKDREVFHIRGWPEMEWHFESDDGEASVDMRLEMQNVTILPDCVMPNNRFAMWLAICRAEGEVRFQGRRTKVRGTAFYDHPRICVERHETPPFGWYIYTPMHFADGSYLAGYYAEDGLGRQVREYSFGLFVDANGKATWLGESQVSGLVLDSDNKPRVWTSRWTGAGFSAEILATVKPTRIRKAWGGSSVAQTRKENGNIPLVFDCEGVIDGGTRPVTVRGGGLAEHLVRAGYQPSWP